MAGTASPNNQNIYIASLPRSGSTLLGMILNQHPDCFNIGESFYWDKLNPKNVVCTCGIKGCSILSGAYKKIKNNANILCITNTVTTMDSILQNGDYLSMEHLTEAYSEDIIRSCDGFDDLAEIFRRVVDRRVIIDTSSNVIVASNLVKRKNWKIIILIRDPRGIICSLKKAAIRHDRNIPKNFWCIYIIDFLKRARFFCNMNNAILIKYEDLCNNPEGTLKRLCDFLKIDYDKKMLKYRRDKGHLLMANRMRFGKNEDIAQDNSWKDYLSDKENEMICNDIRLINAYKQYNYNIKKTFL